MAFEKFVTSGGRSGARTITLSDTQVSISAAAVAEYGLGRAQTIALWYDKETNRIGVSASADPSDSKISRPKRSRGTVLSAKGFVAQFEARGRFALVAGDEAKHEPHIYTADLGKPLRTWPPRKKGSAE